MDKVYETKEKCSGCGACKSVCPTAAITMEQDENGFYYPYINGEKCIDCMSCRQVCHFSRDDLFQGAAEKVSALQSRDKKLLKTSQSGGAFAELARNILYQGGVVYGAAFDKDYGVSHIRINSQGQLYRLQGSKYVQSSTEDVFEAVKADLKNNLKVLFSGTPCQVAALYAYVGQGQKLLYTVDIICHGVLPPSLWKDYLDHIQTRYGKIKYASFREKSFGWQVHDELFIAGGRRLRKNIYRKIFYRDILLRPCCYSTKGDMFYTACRYAGMSRVSDMTIGDFWGIKQPEDIFEMPEAGISLCIVNNDRGRKMLELIKPYVLWVEKNADEALGRQPHLSGQGNPVSVHMVEKARQEYRRKGFAYIASRYGENGMAGIYPKGIRFILHIKNKLLKKMGIASGRDDVK